MKKLYFAAALMVAGLSACSTSSTAPTKRVAPAAAKADLMCESGYVIVVNEEGDPYCAPAGH